MKKFISLLFVLVCTLLISSCGNSNFDIRDTDNYYAQIEVENYGVINLKLEWDEAPDTVDNFISLVSRGFYRGTIFHRVIDDFMIQTGGYFLKGNLLKTKEAKTITGEFKENGHKNNIKHKLGTISMARATDFNSASSQFFLCSSDNCSHLDGFYAAFGNTTDEESNDVIVRISKQRTSHQYGMDDFPNELIIIKNITLSNTKFTR